MPEKTVSRRSWMGALAGGAVAAPIVGSAWARPEDPSARAQNRAPSAAMEALVVPLVAGSRLARWEVIAIEPTPNGALAVALRGEAGAPFVLEVMAADPSPLAAKPPASTKRFSVFVRNGGDGAMPTHEDQGIAAMALAEIVRRNEANASDAALLTHEERIALHPQILPDDAETSA